MSTQTAATKVYINNEQAKKALTELESKLSSVNAARKKAFEEGDLTALTALDKEAKALGSEAEKLKKRFFDVNSVLQDLSGASVSDLNKALSNSRSELSKMRQTDPGYTEKKKQVSDLKDALEQANTSAGSHNKAMEGLKAGYMATSDPNNRHHQPLPSWTTVVLSALVTAINQLNLKLNYLYAKVVMSEFKKAEADYEKELGAVTRN